MFTALLQIKNYKLFVVNMLLLGMGIAVTVPYLILFATKDLGMTTTQYGLQLALATISQFIVNSIIARFSDTHHLNRKILIITALFMGGSELLNLFLRSSNMVIHRVICVVSRIICTSNATIVCLCQRINQCFKFT